MIGSDVTSAFWKSLANDSDSSLSALASPNSSIRKSGFAFASRSVVASGASTSASASAPSRTRISKLTSAELPSREMLPRFAGAYGLFTLET